MKRDEIVAYTIIIAFFVFMLVNSFKLHEIRRFGEMGSGFWPIMILSTAAILSIILLIFSITKYTKERKTTPIPSPSPEALAELKDRRKKYLSSVILLLLYIIIMPWIGFILSTLIYVITFIFALGERRKLVLIASPVLVTALIIITFAKFIAIPFPRGAGIFAAFSRFFY